MAAPDYATEAEYTADTGATATPRELRRASRLVQDATRLSYVNLDDTDTSEALRDAVITQVLYWQTTGDHGLSSAEWSSASIAGASYTRAAAGEGTAGRRLCGEAYAILRTAGLLHVWVSVRG